MNLEGQAALVTGGNRGIGLEICRGLARASHRVILAARDFEQASARANELRADGRVRPVALDVTDEASIVRLRSELERANERLFAIVNNAGVALDGFDSQIAERTLDVNFHGPARVLDVLEPRLADGGNVVNVSSGMGELSVLPAPLRKRFATPELTRAELERLVGEFVRAVAEGRHIEAGWPSNAYRVSKLALNALTRIQARELAARGIKVNAICPGWVRTRMGGAGATLSAEVAAGGGVWAATLPADGPSGGFFRDASPIAW